MLINYYLCLCKKEISHDKKSRAQRISLHKLVSNRSIGFKMKSRLEISLHFAISFDVVLFCVRIRIFIQFVIEKFLKSIQRKFLQNHHGLVFCHPMSDAHSLSRGAVFWDCHQVWTECHSRIYRVFCQISRLPSHQGKIGMATSLQMSRKSHYSQWELLILSFQIEGIPNLYTLETLKELPVISRRQLFYHPRRQGIQYYLDRNHGVVWAENQILLRRVKRDLLTEAQLNSSDRKTNRQVFRLRSSPIQMRTSKSA